MKKIVSLLCLIVLLAGIFTACGDKEKNDEKNQANGEEKLKIVTTIYPPYDFAKKIGGDSVDVKMLLKPGMETHSYEPSPKDIEAIKNSDIFICIGSHNEEWVNNIFESMDGEKPDVIKMMDFVELLDSELVDGMEHKHKEQDEHHEEAEKPHNGDEEQHEEKEHSHSVDEHVWTSPKNAIEIVKVIADKMIEKDEKNIKEYETSSKAYISELEKIDTDLQNIVDSAKRKTILFADRFPFRYLANEYGLNYYAAFTGCSSETEADAGTIVFLKDKVIEEQLPVVFTIEMANGRMADAICEDTGAKKLILHSCHNLTKDELEAGEDYISVMRSNLKNLEKALN